MSELKFKGKITEIRDIRTGQTEKGEWASLEFEVTEVKDDYPQVALFDYFKNGEYVKFAKDFNDYFKVGDEVDVAFNLKKTVYQKKDGSGEGTFYKTSAWKLEKINSANTDTSTVSSATETPAPEDDGGLPF